MTNGSDFKCYAKSEQKFCFGMVQKQGEYVMDMSDFIED